MGTGHNVCRCAYRGGNWNNGSNAGVFNVNLNNPRSNSNSNIGFRYLAMVWHTSKLRVKPQRGLT